MECSSHYPRVISSIEKQASLLVLFLALASVFANVGNWMRGFGCTDARSAAFGILCYIGHVETKGLYENSALCVQIIFRLDEYCRLFFTGLDVLDFAKCREGGKRGKGSM